RSKLRQAGYGEETAFVPQACITARKTMKTGCAALTQTHKLTKLTNSQTYKLTKLTNSQTHKLTKLTSGLCPLRAADLTGSGPHAAIACIQGFPLCQRHPPLSDDDADTKGFLGFGFKN
ncbi:MAG: hypothetical protein SPG93_06035, partial [Prevotella sp.]|nr:hypothetical protein [Prevotella sp.]